MTSSIKLTQIYSFYRTLFTLNAVKSIQFSKFLALTFLEPVSSPKWSSSTQCSSWRKAPKVASPGSKCSIKYTKLSGTLKIRKKKFKNFRNISIQLPYNFSFKEVYDPNCLVVKTLICAKG